jgi:prolyl oligopeptidase
MRKAFSTPAIPSLAKELEAALKGHAVYYHRVGTPQSADRLIYERKDLPDWVVGGSTTEDKRYLLVFIAKGSGRTNRLYYADLGDPNRPNVAAAIKPVVETDDAEYLPIGNRGSMIYVKTDRDAPNRKVVAIDLQQPAPSAWKTIVPERKEAIEEVAVIGGRVVAQYLVDVQSRLALFDLNGQQQGEIALPAAGTVASFGGREDMPEIFYMFSSPIYPTTVFRYDPDARRSAAFEAAKPPVDISRYETKALFARSKDGTRIPFFLTARKELPRNGANPTMLYGYGGFSVSTLPRYRSDVPAWLEMGGIWVTANMRGGAEYGEAWHKAGMLEKKQNVFDDSSAWPNISIRESSTRRALGIMGAPVVATGWRGHGQRLICSRPPVRRKSWIRCGMTGSRAGIPGASTDLGDAGQFVA